MNGLFMDFVRFTFSTNIFAGEATLRLWPFTYVTMEILTQVM